MMLKLSATSSRFKAQLEPCERPVSNEPAYFRGQGDLA
jgi:hypothetical protein